MSNIVSRKLSVHKEHELLLSLESAGLGNEEAQTIIESKGNIVAVNIVSLVRSLRSRETPTSFKRAYQIMGKNFIGPVHAADHFGAKFGENLSKLWTVPFSEALLDECKDTHILFAGYPLSIMDIRSKVPRDFFVQEGRLWYQKYAFANADKVKMRWYLMRKTVVPGSLNKTKEAQERMLGKDEEVPRACELVYMIILANLVYGENLFGGIYARCKDVTENNGRVCVQGYVGPNGGIGLDRFTDAYIMVGSASMKISS